MDIPGTIVVAVIAFVLSPWVAGVVEELRLAWNTVHKVRPRARVIYGLLMGATYLGAVSCLAIPLWLTFNQSIPPCPTRSSSSYSLEAHTFPGRLCTASATAYGATRRSPQLAPITSAIEKRLGGGAFQLA